MYRGAYVQRVICVSKLIGLACRGNEIYHFCFVLFCIQGQIPSTSPPGGLYSEGRFNRGFLGGLYLEGLIFGIFMVSHLLYFSPWGLSFSVGCMVLGQGSLEVGVLSSVIKRGYPKSGCRSIARILIMGEVYLRYARYRRGIVVFGMIMECVLVACKT